MLKFEIRNHLVFIDNKQTAYRPTPNRSGVMNPDTIIDHDTASNPLDPSVDIGWLTMPVAQASAHVVIDWRGGITQLAPFNVQCWHAGPSKYGNRQNFNAFSIGIEHDNPGYLRKRARALPYLPRAQDRHQSAVSARAYAGDRSR